MVGRRRRLSIEKLRLLVLAVMAAVLAIGGTAATVLAETRPPVSRSVVTDQVSAMDTRSFVASGRMYAATPGPARTTYDEQRTLVQEGHSESPSLERSRVASGTLLSPAQRGVAANTGARRGA